MKLVYLFGKADMMILRYVAYRTEPAFDKLLNFIDSSAKSIESDS